MKIDYEEWVKQGKEIHKTFDIYDWKFFCTCCGNKQSQQDFIALKKGKYYAFNACLNRVKKRNIRGYGRTKVYLCGKEKFPHDQVISGDKIVEVFPFAEK